MRVRRNGNHRLVGLATAVVTGVTVLQLANPAAGVSPATIAAAAHRQPADDTAVLGRTTDYVVFNDRSNHSIYVANVGGRSAPRVIVRHAHAVAVSGDMIEYVSHGTKFWRKLGTSRHGKVPARWTYLAPDGGLRVRQAGHRTYLDYVHLNGRVQHFALPKSLPTKAAHYSVVAGKRQIVVTVSAPGEVPRAAFFNGNSRGSFRLLRTTGLRAGSRLRCDSVVATAVGCADSNEVVRLSGNGRTLPQVSILGPPPIHVAVTSSYTTWTFSAAGSGRACPCIMASVDVTGTAESVISGVTAPFVSAGYGRFYYTAGTSSRTAGVYAALYAGGQALRIAAAPGH